MYDLSILIPARNEMFLSRTIEDILSNIEGNTEIIVGLDGLWAEPGISDHPLVTIVHVSKSIGQRAMTNQLCRLSSAKYVMKVDAHCAFDKGFDRKLVEDMRGHDDWTIAPILRNLHAFNWVCPDGHKRYQSPSGPCKSIVDGKECGKETTREIVWIPKSNPESKSFCFDATPHFLYFGNYTRRPEYKKSLEETKMTESMSLQGSCFMLTREKYWELNICDEKFGSWGSQGIEVACKTWLTGGQVMISHRTWYGHLFRTQGGDFGFPYELPGKDVDLAKNTARELFFEGKFQGTKPLSWLVEKFWPIPGWTQKDLAKLKGEPSKGVLYYTDNQLNMKIASRVRQQILRSGLEVTSVSLKPMKFGNNICLPLERGYLTMYKQILAGLEAMTEDIVFFCEHDVLYHPSHFKFTPEDKSTFYYAGNYWFLRMDDGFALHYDVSPLSGLVAYREPLITHFRERVALIEKEGFSYNIGFEPMTHGRIKWDTVYNYKIFNSEFPNVDICHGGNVTKKRWRKDQFRRHPTGWQEGDINSIPGWPELIQILK